MKLGIFAKTFDGGTSLEVLTSAKSAGYDAVQYNMACSGLGSLPTDISRDAAEAVHAASIETGVAIAAVSATYNMIHPVRIKREAGRRSFEAIASSAARMGTHLLTVCTGSYDPYDQWRYHPDNSSAAAWEDMCKEFSTLISIADKYDVLIGVEPELANVIDSAQRARELIETLQSDRIRIIFDPANLFEVESSERRKMLIENAFELLQDRVSLAHAKDRRENGSFTTVGTGVLDYPHYLTMLLQAGFQGTLIAHGFDANEAEDVATFLKGELAAVEIGE
jgi:sugar phosphate isomerase/epimerase